MGFIRDALGVCDDPVHHHLLFPVQLLPLGHKLLEGRELVLLIHSASLSAYAKAGLYSLCAGRRNKQAAGEGCRPRELTEQ